MKRHALAVLALSSTLGLPAAASAQNALFAESNVVVDVTFYSGESMSDATSLNEVQVNNSPFGVKIPHIESATYAVLEFGGQSYTFELAGSGVTKEDVQLLVDKDADQTMTLSAVLSELNENPALLGELSS